MCTSLSLSLSLSVSVRACVCVCVCVCVCAPRITFERESRVTAWEGHSRRQMPLFVTVAARVPGGL